MTEDDLRVQLDDGGPRMTITYTCVGSVRGPCGRKHRSIDAAVGCLDRDRAGCQSQGGYSDREIRRSDGTWVELDTDDDGRTILREE